MIPLNFLPPFGVEPVANSRTPAPARRTDRPFPAPLPALSLTPVGPRTAARPQWRRQRRHRTDARQAVRAIIPP